VIVLSDLDLGMNQWMTEKFKYPDMPIDRGKILWEEDLIKHLAAHENRWGRYLDIDGDGIPYRTLPGNQHPQSAYFARGTGHDEYAQYSEDAKEWENGLNRIKRKIDNSRENLPLPEIRLNPNAKIGIISSGSVNPAAEEAVDLLLLDDLPVDHLRVRAIPFSSQVGKFLKDHDRVYVVEMNRDGQLRQVLTLEFPGQAEKLIKAAHTDGLPLTAKWIKETILSYEESRK
jgi:2-oxoglutarate ferredoxin oxidoreductase subunit alpha